MSGRKPLLFSLAAVLLVFGVAELVCRVVELWRPPRSVDYGLGFDPESRVFVPDPIDPGFRVTDPAKLDFFREQRFATEKPPRTFRIAAVGGGRCDGPGAQ